MTTKHGINFDAPTAESLRVDVMARNLARLRLWDMRSGASLAQVAVALASTLRGRGFDAPAQMSGLFYFASAAFVPQPQVPVLDSGLAREIFRIQAEMSLRVQKGIFAKFALPLLDDMQQHASATLERVGEGAHPSEIWNDRLAEYIFLGAALMLARETSHTLEMQVASELPAWMFEGLWILGPISALECEKPTAKPAAAVKSSMAALSEDLREVFQRHGFDPSGPAYQALVEAAEKLEKKSMPAADKPSTPPASKPN